MVSYVSIIASHLVQPLADLLGKLILLPEPSDPEAPKHGDELGYSAAICLLTAVIVESFAMRARFLNSEDEASRERAVHRFIAKRYPDFEWIKEVAELFIIRDLIAHNHLWRIESTSNRNVWTELLTKELDPLTEEAKGKKYSKYVDINIARTRTLCLHVIPTQLERSDVAKVLRVAKNTLSVMAAKEGAILGVEANQALFRDRLMNLPDILQEAIRAI